MTARYFFEAEPDGRISYSVNVYHELEQGPHSNWIESDGEIEAFMKWYEHSTQTLHDVALNTATINKLTATVEVADDIVISNIPSGSDLEVDEVLTASNITGGIIELTFSEPGEYYVKIVSGPEYFEEQWMVTVGEA